MRKPELLAPAGDMERLRMAVLYGADAVYLAGTSFGMRSFAGNFSPEELPCAVAYAHDHGVRVHVTVNTMPRSGEVDALPAHLERLNDAGVDALILADLGAFTLAGKYAPPPTENNLEDKHPFQYPEIIPGFPFEHTQFLLLIQRSRIVDDKRTLRRDHLFHDLVNLFLIIPG